MAFENENKHTSMRIKITLFFILALGFASISATAQTSKSNFDFLNKLGDQSRVAFVENVGQLSPIKELQGKKVLFSFEDDKGLTAYFTSTGVIYRVSKQQKVSEAEYEEAMRENGSSEREENDLAEKNKAKFLTKTEFVEMNWEGANSNTKVIGKNQTSAYFNFYMPSINKDKVIGNVKGYTKIVYENIYPFIDIEYTIHPEKGMKYSYILHPGANPSDIRMDYYGANLKMDGEGNMIISTDCGDITDYAPLTFKAAQVDGKIISSQFELVKKNTVGFTLANGMKTITETIIIDPWQVGPNFPASGFTPNDLSVDGAGNVLVYSYNTTPSSRIDKYSPLGVFMWTFNLTTSAGYSGFQGDVASDAAGNVYVSIGLGPNNNTGFYNTIKINPTGTALIWGNTTAGTGTNNMMETWTITFNCNHTQFYQSGGGRIVSGTTYFNMSVEEPVNAATGVEGTLIENDSMGDIYCTYYAANNLVYHMTGDSNVTPDLAGGLLAATSGADNNLICFNAASGVRLFRVHTGYAYIDGDVKAPGSVGMDAITSSCQYLYTTNGASIDRWDPLTGAHFNQVTIPGGSTTPGAVNAGITTDKCGNVFVGSNNNIYEYDATLNLINTIGGLPGVVFDLAWGNVANTNLMVCGGTTNGTTFLASVAVTPCVLPNFVTVTAVQPSCASPTGSATATATFCGGPYTYLWSNGQTTQTITNLAPGTYTVTVSSTVSCPYSYVQTQTIVIAPGSGTLSTTQVANNVTCFGGCNGSATVTPSGGTGPYTYNWTPSGGNLATASALCQGSYSCTVTDATGCSAIVPFTITQPAQIVLTTTSTPAGCNMTNGSATVTPSGGVGPYDFVWTDALNNVLQTANNQPGSNVLNNLGTGTYNVLVTDANNCLSNISVIVTGAPGSVASVMTNSPVTCFGNCNGTATATLNGGTAPYTYQWSANAANQTTLTATGLCVGTYTVNFADANGCSGTSTVSVTGPTQVTATVAAVPPTICIGQSSNLTATPAGGLGSGYTYAWTPVGTGSTQTVTVSPIVTTTYTVVVTDGNGCVSAPASITVTVNPPLNVTLLANPSPVCIGSPSTLTATPNGGNGGPYTYTWLPVGTGGNSITVSVTPTVTTTYTVILSDGCTTPNDSAVVTITVSAPPVPTFTGTPLTGCAPLCVNFTTPNNPTWISCAWNFGDGSPVSTNFNPNHCYTITGCYNVTLSITDASGCVGTVTMPNYVCVSPNVVAQFTASPQPTDIFNSTVFFTDQSTGAPTSWTWYFGGLDSSNAQNPNYHFPSDVAGCYDVVLIANNAANCPGVDTMRICIDPDYVIYFPNAFTPNGDGVNDNFIGVGEGIDKYEMWIFDRWGNLIFYTDNMGHPWDGKVQNKSDNLVQEDVYVWKAKVTDVFGKKHKFIGHVSVIR